MRLFTVTLLLTSAMVYAQTPPSGLKSTQAQAEALMQQARPTVTPAQLEAMAAQDVAQYAKTTTEEIRRITALLAMSGRGRDPFGISTASNLVDDAAVAVEKSSKEDEPSQPTAADAVRSLRVVGVNQGRGEFFVGSRVIRVNDTLTLMFSGSRFRVIVRAISFSEITFDDVSDEAGGKVVLPLNIVPSLSPASLVPVPLN